MFLNFRLTKYAKFLLFSEKKRNLIIEIRYNFNTKDDIVKSVI